MGSYAVYDSCRCVKARHCADGGTRAEVAGCLTRVVVLPGLGMAMKRWGSARSAEGGCITDYGLFGAGRFLVWFSEVGVLQSMHVEVLEGASYWFRVSCCSPMIDLQISWLCLVMMYSKSAYGVRMISITRVIV